MGFARARRLGAPAGRLLASPILDLALAGVSVLGLSAATPASACTRITPTIAVPADCPTIQDAIDVALAGDTVLVSPGVYAERITLRTGVEVRGQGASTTTVDGGGLGVVVSSSGATGAKLSSLTITGGDNSDLSFPANVGSGVKIIGGSVTIDDCVIAGNVGQNGGGIGAVGANLVVQGSTIADNQVGSGGGGGGISLYQSSTGWIENSVLTNNAATWGGGIFVFNSQATVTGCLLEQNEAGGANSPGGSAILVQQSAATIVNCTIAKSTTTTAEDCVSLLGSPSAPAAATMANTAIVGNAGHGIAVGSDATLTLSHNLWWQNTSGPITGGSLDASDIELDPLFADFANGDYHLSDASPAVDAGDPQAPYISSTDLDGTQRVRDGDHNGAPVVDIGAFELMACGTLATGQGISRAAGDDGAVQAGIPLGYTDNGDGTITDNSTGLMWEKKVQLDSTPDKTNPHDADNCYPWYGRCVPATATSWNGAGGYCGTDTDCTYGTQPKCLAQSGAACSDGLTLFQWVEKLNTDAFAGYTDWRIPNAKELQSFMDYGRYHPAVSEAFHGASCGAACSDITDPACSCTKSHWHWTSTTALSSNIRAWGISMTRGDVNGVIGKTSRRFARAVRGGSPPGQVCLLATGQTVKHVSRDDGDIRTGMSPSYTDNGDGTITDNTTGLMWEKKVQLDSTANAANPQDADNCYPWAGRCVPANATNWANAGGLCGTDADCQNASKPKCLARSTSPCFGGMTVFQFVEMLNGNAFASYTDWRVPNLRELQTIINYGRYPATSDAFSGASCGGGCADVTSPACSCTGTQWYWSSTSRASASGVAYFAGVWGNIAAGTKTARVAVRAVRGGL